MARGTLQHWSLCFTPLSAGVFPGWQQHWNSRALPVFRLALPLCLIFLAADHCMLFLCAWAAFRRRRCRPQRCLLLFAGHGAAGHVREAHPVGGAGGGQERGAGRRCVCDLPLCRGEHDCVRHPHHRPLARLRQPAVVGCDDLLRAGPWRPGRFSARQGAPVPTCHLL